MFLVFYCLIYFFDLMTQRNSGRQPEKSCNQQVAELISKWREVSSRGSQKQFFFFPARNIKGVFIFISTGHQIKRTSSDFCWAC
jgi:hypothetical protein